MSFITTMLRAVLYCPLSIGGYTGHVHCGKASGQLGEL